MENISIALCIDHNFIQHCAATINSIMFSYKGGADVVFYIVHNDLSETEQADLNILIKKDKFKIVFVRIDDTVLKDMPLGENTISSSITLSTYFRILLSYIIPNEVKRIIYLDSDIYVNDSIDKLWNINMKDFAIAGVPEPYQDKKRQRLDLPDNCYYVNAGVSVMNLEKLRAIDYPKKALEYAHKNKDKIIYHDQDIQNAVLYDSTTYLPQRWNMIDIYLYKNLPIMEKDFVDEILKYRNNPSLIHFAGYIKPWHKECKNPYRALYWQALKGTKWENERKESREKNFIKRIKLMARQILSGNPYFKNGL